MIKKVLSRIPLSGWLGTFSFLAYAGCYMGKNILSALMPQMMKENIVGRDHLGMMGSALLLSYGIGQLINGAIGDRIRAKTMVAVGLSLAAVAVLLFPFFTSSAALVLWSFCGFACSMLWGPISKLVGEHTSRKAGKLILTFLTIASVVGTAVTYGLATLSTIGKNWKMGFFLAGIFLLLIAGIWTIAIGYLERQGHLDYSKGRGHFAGNLPRWGSIFNKTFILMTAVAVINGILRNAVGFWIPTFISEKLGVSLELVGPISSVLPLINIGGTFLGLYLLRFTSQDEKKMCFFLFLFTLIMFALLIYAADRFVVFSICLLFLASAAMTSACNMIFGVYVLGFADTGRLSGITGFLDFSAYIAAAGANVLFSKVLHVNWSSILLFWTAAALVGSICAFLSFFRRKNRLPN